MNIKRKLAVLLAGAVLLLCGCTGGTPSESAPVSSAASSKASSAVSSVQSTPPVSSAATPETTEAELSLFDLFARQRVVEILEAYPTKSAAECVLTAAQIKLYSLDAQAKNKLLAEIDALQPASASSATPQYETAASDQAFPLEVRMFSGKENKKTTQLTEQTYYTDNGLLLAAKDSGTYQVAVYTQGSCATRDEAEPLFSGTITGDTVVWIPWFDADLTDHLYLRIDVPSSAGTTQLFAYAAYIDYSIEQGQEVSLVHFPILLGTSAKLTADGCFISDACTRKAAALTAAEKDALRADAQALPLTYNDCSAADFPLELFALRVNAEGYRQVILSPKAENFAQPMEMLVAFIDTTDADMDIYRLGRYNNVQFAGQLRAGETLTVDNLALRITYRHNGAVYTALLRPSMIEEGYTVSLQAGVFDEPQY